NAHGLADAHHRGQRRPAGQQRAEATKYGAAAHDADRAAKTVDKSHEKACIHLCAPVPLTLQERKGQEMKCCLESARFVRSKRQVETYVHIRYNEKERSTR